MSIIARDHNSTKIATDPKTGAEGLREKTLKTFATKFWSDFDETIEGKHRHHRTMVRFFS